ncbi:MAG: prolipoprotein diacylglyceryl transferase [Bacilli bacterium]|nr:prolipoprotein diacylglyceryl transferase [Bacilli bacterium]
MKSVIDLGFVSIHIYSLCILIGVLLSFYLILKESEKHGFDKEKISDLLFYTIIFGIIGARLYYCLFNLDYYLSNPFSVLKIWEGGLAIHGGIIAGLITIFVYAKRHKLNVLWLLDFIVVGLIIAQAIGRWGNFFNGEAHGSLTTLSHLKGMNLPSFIIKGMKIDGVYYIPTFLYESLWCLLGFIIMILVRHKKNIKIGYLTGFYFIWYSLERFFVEGMRTDSLMLGLFKIAQIISIIMFICGIVIFIYSFINSSNYNKKLERNDKND